MGIAKAMVPPDGVRGMLIAVIKLRLKQHEENLGREVWMTAYDRIYKALNSRGIYHEATDFDSPLIGRVGRKGDDFMSSEEKQRLIQLGAENDIVSQKIMIQTAISNCKSEPEDVRPVIRLMDTIAHLVVGSARYPDRLATLVNTFDLFERDCAHIQMWIQDSGYWVCILNDLDRQKSS